MRVKCEEKEKKDKCLFLKIIDIVPLIFLGSNFNASVAALFAGRNLSCFNSDMDKLRCSDNSSYIYIYM